MEGVTVGGDAHTCYECGGDPAQPRVHRRPREVDDVRKVPVGAPPAESHYWCFCSIDDWWTQRVLDSWGGDKESTADRIAKAERVMGAEAPPDLDERIDDWCEYDSPTDWYVAQAIVGQIRGTV